MTNHHNKTNFFWTSYADMMTSLFFVMLVLYALTFVILKREQNRLRVKAELLEKIQSIQRAVDSIDPSGNYFAYRPDFKKHVLNVAVQYKRGSSDIEDIGADNLKEVLTAGQLIRDRLTNVIKKDPDTKFLLIVEGQASRNFFEGHEYFNYKLSYDRALSLLNFWQFNGIKIGEGNLKNVELIIAGSGEQGAPREKEDVKNQRFLIHIVPKPGDFSKK
jgi:hypothetical protein